MQIFTFYIHHQIQDFLKYYCISQNTNHHKYYFIWQTFSLGSGATGGLARGKAMLGACGVGIKLSLVGVSGDLHMGFFRPSITSPSPASGTAVKVKCCCMTCLWQNIIVYEVKDKNKLKNPHNCCYNMYSYISPAFHRDALPCTTDHQQYYCNHVPECLALKKTTWKPQMTWFLRLNCTDSVEPKINWMNLSNFLQTPLGQGQFSGTLLPQKLYR